MALHIKKHADETAQKVFSVGLRTFSSFEAIHAFLANLK